VSSYPTGDRQLARLTSSVLAPGGVAVFAGIDRGHWVAFEEALVSVGLRCSRSDGRYLGQQGEHCPCIILLAEKSAGTDDAHIAQRVPLHSSTWQLDRGEPGGGLVREEASTV
jgi:hypothetical protein